MYDKKLKQWTASEPDIRTQTDDSEEEKLYQDYARADAMLTKAADGSKNIEAIYLMERTAKKGYAPACLAMAQMFEYGWAVAKSARLSLMWYQKAANAGSDEAKNYLEKRRKAKRNTVITVSLLIFLLASAVVLTMWIFKNKKEEPITSELVQTVIFLPEQVELKKPETIVQHIDIMREIRENYDTDAMRRGEEETNRILLIYHGNELKLSDFAVAAASTDGEMIVLQFTDHAEMMRCYEYLSSLEDVTAVSIDNYTTKITDTAQTAAAYPTATSSPPYHSSVSGYDYLTWGAIAMQMDEYAAYLSHVCSGKRLTVAMIDSGVEPNAITQDRLIDGIDLIYGGNGKRDTVGHGTHVSGIILECTQGLNIDVMPIAVSVGGLSVSNSAICLGIAYALSFPDVKVINMSLGGPCQHMEEYYINQALAQGVTVVVASGNENVLIDDEDVCPAHITGCITVGAVDENGMIADFSNYGSQVDVCAPGVDILSYLPAPEYLGKWNIHGNTPYFGFGSND